MRGDKNALSPNERIIVEFFRRTEGEIVLCKKSNGVKIVAHMHGRKACHDIAIALQEFYRTGHLTQ